MSSFRDDLLKFKDINFPEPLQILLDTGIIQECEQIEGMYYINFGFHLTRVPIYNYDINPYEDTFFRCEYAEIIYYGGFAVDSDMKIHKGILYPCILNSTNDDYIFTELLIEGELSTIYTMHPQSINYDDNLSLEDVFPNLRGLHVFNVTTKHNVWVDFIKQEEFYTGFVPVRYDSEGKMEKIGTNAYGDDSSYFGKIWEAVYKEGGKFSHYNMTNKVYRYEGYICDESEAIPISYIEKLIKEHRIYQRIASKVYCSKILSKSIYEAGKSIENGLLALSGATAGSGIATSRALNNIADELHMGRGNAYPCYN